MTLATYKWTIERYHQAIAAGIFQDQAVELVRGELVVMPPEGELHACRGDVVAEYLRQVLGDRAQIREGKPITLAEIASEPEPDLAIVQRLFWEYNEHHPYADNIFWLIEFANTSLKKDLEVKGKLYAEAGIPEYWVVNLQAAQLVVFRDPLGGDYQSRQTYSTGMIRPLAFPEVELAIEVLLGRDRWTPAS